MGSRAVGDIYFDGSADYFGRAIEINNDILTFDFDCSGNIETFRLRPSDHVAVSGDCEYAYYGSDIGGGGAEECAAYLETMDSIGVGSGEKYYLIEFEKKPKKWEGRPEVADTYIYWGKVSASAHYVNDKVVIGGETFLGENFQYIVGVNDFDDICHEFN